MTNLPATSSIKTDLFMTPQAMLSSNAVTPDVSDTAAKASGADFRHAMLARLKGLNANQATQSREDKAHEAARQFVSTALVMPLLKQMRSSVFKSDYFHGGKGEDAFGPQLDQVLADRITQRMSTPSNNPQAASQAGSPVQGQTLGIVDAVYRQMMHRGQSASARRINLHG